jgi:hypothetical protein
MRPDDVQFLITKLDKIDSRLDAQGEVLVRNTVSLEHHIKRTDLLELNMAEHQKTVASELKPLKRAYNLGAAAAIILGGAVSAAKILKEFGIF